MELDLSWNQFSGRSAMDLLKGIAVNSKLTVLNLSWNGFGNTASLGVAEVLVHNQTIHEFDVSYNRIGLEGAMVIAKGLKENEEHSFYVPKNYTISHLRAFLTSKIFSQRSSHEASYFLFAYGCILNNHEKIGTIYEKFRHQIKNADKGLEIKYTEMSSFGGGAHSGDTMV